MYDVKIILKAFNIRNEVKGLKYRSSAHKSKLNRWYEVDITLYQHFVFYHVGHLENHPK